MGSLHDDSDCILVVHFPARGLLQQINSRVILGKEDVTNIVFIEDLERIGKRDGVHIITKHAVMFEYICPRVDEDGIVFSLPDHISPPPVIIEDAITGGKCLNTAHRLLRQTLADTLAEFGCGRKLDGSTRDYSGDYECIQYWTSPLRCERTEHARQVDGEHWAQHQADEKQEPDVGHSGIDGEQREQNVLQRPRTSPSKSEHGKRRQHQQKTLA